MKKANILKTTISISTCLIIGILTFFLTNNLVESGYFSIGQSIFNPTKWFILIVWISLYVLMGYSFALIWSRKSQSRRTKTVLRNAMILFGVQLFFNFIWIYIFFGLKNPFYALIEILFLWLLVFEMIKTFKKINPYASKLLVPYIIWISCITALNGYIWFINS